MPQMTGPSWGNKSEIRMLQLSRRPEGERVPWEQRQDKGWGGACEGRSLNLSRVALACVRLGNVESGIAQEAGAQPWAWAAPNGNAVTTPTRKGCRCQGCATRTAHDLREPTVGRGPAGGRPAVPANAGCKDVDDDTESCRAASTRDARR